MHTQHIYIIINLKLKLEKKMQFYNLTYQSEVLNSSPKLRDFETLLQIAVTERK